MLVDDASTLGAEDAGPRDGETGPLPRQGGMDGDELAETKTGRVVFHRELHGDGLIAIGEAGAAIGQRHAAPVPEPGRRRTLRGQGLEAQRLDPKLLRIDDAEDDGAGGGHGTGSGAGLGDDSVHGCDQCLGRATDRIEGGAAVLQPVALGAGIVELGLRHGAGPRQTLEPDHAPVEDRDLLVEFALALAHVGDVHRLDGRSDGGEHLAARHTGSEARKSVCRRGQTATDGGLHDAAGIGDRR